MVIAYIEGGVNYSSNGIKDGLDNIYLNEGELPYPEGRDGKAAGRYDFDDNGRFDIRDYAPRPAREPAMPRRHEPVRALTRRARRGAAWRTASTTT